MTETDSNKQKLAEYAPKMYEILVSLLDSIEPYFALTLPREEWDEYDHMMNPRWIAAKAIVDEISAKDCS